MNFLKTEYIRTNGTQLKIGCNVERFIFSEQDNYKLEITIQRNSPNSLKGLKKALLFLLGDGGIPQSKACTIYHYNRVGYKKIVFALQKNYSYCYTHTHTHKS